MLSLHPKSLNLETYPYSLPLLKNSQRKKIKNQIKEMTDIVGETMFKKYIFIL